MYQFRTYLITYHPTDLPFFRTGSLSVEIDAFTSSEALEIFEQQYLGLVHSVEEI